MLAQSRRQAVIARLRSEIASTSTDERPLPGTAAMALNDRVWVACRQTALWVYGLAMRRRASARLASVDLFKVIALPP